ncbi:4-amino-4-deoxy-L-arabinose transferase [Nocardioides panacis]|uniref:4-amino-4-deoxy-L-arabinose transferase n=1 Tax=Nocardioides panacis TaxID=2849501 RepID=A0A975T2Q5_9ACTN|nr:4-amino-4-deoxy-L-arabinose transferase [Nocardioides panacis]
MVAAVLAAPATLGAGRLVCVDGPSGAGKTTLAAALDRGFRDALRPGGRSQVLHLDNVYEGWDGLAAGMATVAASVVAPLRAGAPGRYRRFDWHAMAWAEERTLPPCDVLVLEGVGAWSSAIRDAVTCLVWVETPPALRLERGVARDGEALRPRLLAWRAQEEAMYAAERTREHADVVVDGQTGTVRK